MFAISWRAAPVWGLILALSTGPASAQDPRVVTLDDALELSGSPLRPTPPSPTPPRGAPR